MNTIDMSAIHRSSRISTILMLSQRVGDTLTVQSLENLSYDELSKMQDDYVKRYNATLKQNQMNEHSQMRTAALSWVLLVAVLVGSLLSTSGCLYYRDKRSPVVKTDEQGTPHYMGTRQVVTAFPVLSKSAMDNLRSKTSETNTHTQYRKDLGVDRITTEVSEDALRGIVEGAVAGLTGSPVPVLSTDPLGLPDDEGVP